VIRVAAVIEALGRGGAERLLVDTARGLDRARYSLDVYTLFEARRDYAPALKELGIREVCLGLPGPRRLPSAALRLHALLREHEPDLVHTHLYAANQVGRVAARLRRLPVLSTYHDADYEPIVCAGNPGLSRTTQLLLQLLDIASVVLSRARIVAVSDYVAASVQRRLRVPASRTTVIHNGVDTTLFRPDMHERAKTRTQLGLSASRRVLICVGRMTPQKGQTTLIRAMARVRRSLPESQLLLVGEGGSRPDNEALSGRLALTEAISFLGARWDVADLLRASDLLVLPSLHEGFGLVLAEALATGLPVVAARIGPVPEVVTHQTTGLLVPPSDPEALAGAILELLANESRRARMGVRARADAVERFSLPKMVRALEDLYSETARLHPGAGRTP
jgi:glycosyltransferase involved in cell wall biosynthesis